MSETPGLAPSKRAASVLADDVAITAVLLDYAKSVSRCDIQTNYGAKQKPIGQALNAR